MPYRRDSRKGNERGNSHRNSNRNSHRNSNRGKRNREWDRDKAEGEHSGSGERRPFRPGKKKREGPGESTDRKQYVPAERKTFRPGKQRKDRKGNSRYGRYEKKSFQPWKEKRERKKDNRESGEAAAFRLNRYIANAGICSRREADELIATGQVEVNGVVVTELGSKVGPGDKVTYKGKTLSAEKNVYILLNKPKDYITTVSDTHGRKTVMELIRNAGRERVVPVGRLDKNTTGLLLFTNDGDLTGRLTHPSHRVRKLYHVKVNRNFTPEDMQKLAEGFDLEDGFIRVDEVSFVEKGGKNEIGILLHSGRNRIVRRMLEHLGYRVVRLDRVAFANLTKKDLPRGRWRKLSPKEVSLLKRIAGAG